MQNIWFCIHFPSHVEMKRSFKQEHILICTLSTPFGGFYHSGFYESQQGQQGLNRNITPKLKTTIHLLLAFSVTHFFGTCQVFFIFLKIEMYTKSQHCGRNTVNWSAQFCSVLAHNDSHQSDFVLSYSLPWGDIRSWEIAWQKSIIPVIVTEDRWTGHW
jgi:hypothetical protein